MNFSKDQMYKKSFSVDCRGRKLEIDNTKIMGVLNVTPNSLSDGGNFLESHQFFLICLFFFHYKSSDHKLSKHLV